MCGWQVFLPAARPPALPTAKLVPSPAPAACRSGCSPARACFASASNTGPVLYPWGKGLPRVCHGHLLTNPLQTWQWSLSPSGNLVVQMRWCWHHTGLVRAGEIQWRWTSHGTAPSKSCPCCRAGGSHSSH